MRTMNLHFVVFYICFKILCHFFFDSICFSTDGYTDGPASNRTQFPLSGGFFTLDSEHPQWTGQIVLHIRVFIGADSDMFSWCFGVDGGECYVFPELLPGQQFLPSAGRRGFLHPSGFF